MKEPEKTLFVDLGSNATFRWECNFGSEEDWTNFGEQRPIIMAILATNSLRLIAKKMCGPTQKYQALSSPELCGPVH